MRHPFNGRPLLLSDSGVLWQAGGWLGGCLNEGATARGSGSRPATADAIMMSRLPTRDIDKELREAGAYEQPNGRGGSTSVRGSAL